MDHGDLRMLREHKEENQTQTTCQGKFSGSVMTATRPRSQVGSINQQVSSEELKDGHGAWSTEGGLGEGSTERQGPDLGDHSIQF